MPNATTRSPAFIDALDLTAARHCQALAVLSTLVMSLGGETPAPDLTLLKNTIWAVEDLIKQANASMAAL